MGRSHSGSEKDEVVAEQSDRRRSYLILYIDDTPGVLPAPVLGTIPIHQAGVGSNNTEGHKGSHPEASRLHFVLGEIINLDLVLLKLSKNLNKI